LLTAFLNKVLTTHKRQIKTKFSSSLSAKVDLLWMLQKNSSLLPESDALCVCGTGGERREKIC